MKGFLCKYQDAFDGTESRAGDVVSISPLSGTRSFEACGRPPAPGVDSSPSKVTYREPSRAVRRSVNRSHALQLASLAILKYTRQFMDAAHLRLSSPAKLSLDRQR